MPLDQSAEPTLVHVLDRVPHPDLTERDLITLEITDRVVMPGLLAVGGELTTRLRMVAHHRETAADLAKTVRELLPDYFRALAEQSEIATYYDDPIRVIGG